MSHHQQHSSSMVFMAIVKLAVLKDTAPHIGIALNIGTLLITSRSINAQLIPDGTLGTESTVVTPESSEQFLIEDGAAKDSNLFHSFSEFNIDRAQQVNFANPDGIANILTRVTGNNASSIFGTLGVNGDANLFLINPKGIIFGENANIDINGSFFASTAEQINFADGDSFSATNPAESLLTVNIPLGVQFGSDPESIQAQQASIDARDVTLLGGNINLEQTNINAPGGEVELGSLTEAGIIDFDGDFGRDLARGNINLSDRSLINVIAGGGGNITIDARNLTLTDSNFQTGIGVGLGNESAVAGNVHLDATENIVLNDSEINNNLESNSLGNSGIVQIETTDLILNNSRIISDTKSMGNAGDIIINVTNRLEVFSNPENSNVEDIGNFNFRKGIFAIVTPEGMGDGGNINITSPEITLSGLGGIDSSTVGIGNAGGINIQSDRVIITEGAGVFANGRGIGDAGEILINATEFIDISDKLIPLLGPEGRPSPGGIIADVGRNNQSNGGNITLNTGRLTIGNGAIITTDTKGIGSGGNINITAQDLVEIVGRNQSDLPSQIVSAVRKNSQGNGGNIFITTNNFSVRDGAVINVGTQSIGNSGNLSISASGTLNIQGTSASGIPSRLVAQVGEEATGKGGDIVLSAEDLSIVDGGQVSAATLGSGQGGSVTLNIRDNISIGGNSSTVDESNNPGLSEFIRDPTGEFIPSGIFASSPGIGNADALSINTSNITLSDRAQISVSSQQQGAAGNLSIDADNINLANSILSAETVEGENANIFLNTSSLQLSDRSLITTNATQAATGGNIAIDTDILVALNNSDITANATNNFGGRVSISAQAIFGTEGREFLTPQSDITATSSLGTEFSGIIELDISETDPTKGIIRLPENFIDATQQIAASCNLERDNNFVVTGRGGLAPSPQEFLRGQNVLQDWRVSLMDNARWTADNEQFSTNEEPSSIQEAEKWIVNSQGRVELVASGNKDGGDLWSQTMKCSSTS